MINTAFIGKMAGKVFDSALHAGIFAYVSKKVSYFMDNKRDAEKFRVEETKKLEDKTV